MEKDWWLKIIPKFLSFLKNWLTLNWQWLSSIILSLLILYFSIKTFLRNKEARVQESIRDAGEMGLTINSKVKPVLHSCKFFPNVETVIDFKFYTGTQGSHPSTWRLAGPRGYDYTPLEKIKGVKSSLKNESGVQIKCSTVDSTKCREISEAILVKIREIRKSK